MDLKSAKLPDNMSLTASNQKKFNQKVHQISEKGLPDSGVIYLGHIPHGFFEEQMKLYFSQFGRVNKLRISRSKRTGRIKGYAFVEFESDSVAKIVADTMNNYLMFHKLLKCEYMPSEKVHRNTFIGHDRKFKKPKSHKIAIARHNGVKTDMQLKKSDKRIRRKNAKASAILAEMGIQYEFNIEKKSQISEEKTAEKTVLSEEEDSPKAKRKRTGSPVRQAKTVTDPSEIQVLYDDQSSSENEDKTSNDDKKVKRKRNDSSSSPTRKQQKTTKNTPKSEKKGGKSSDEITTPVVLRRSTRSTKSPLTGRQIAKAGSAGDKDNVVSSEAKLKTPKQIGSSKKLKSKK